MKKTLLFCALAGLVIACSKDKFETKPQIKIKSTSADIVPKSSAFRVILEFTDKEGDMSDSILIVRQRLNKKSPIKGPTLPYGIPSFPKTTQGEIQVDLDYDFGLTVGLPPIPKPGGGGNSFEPDTLNLKFVARDKAGNKSDTATANVIVIR